MGEAESAFFSKEAVLKKYESFKTLLDKNPTSEKPLYLDDFLKEANISVGQRILEIGINPGHLAVYLARIVGDNGKVVLAELDKIIISDAEENIKNHKVGNVVRIAKAESKKLAFRTNYFDVVLSDRTTSLLKNKSDLIREMARVLKSGGRLVIADCVLQKTFTKSQVEQFRQEFACIFQAVAIEDYIEMFENSGLQEIKTIFFLDKGCVRPHSKIEQIAQSHIGFAIIVGEKLLQAKRDRTSSV